MEDTLKPNTGPVSVATTCSHSLICVSTTRGAAPSPDYGRDRLPPVARLCRHTPEEIRVVVIIVSTLGTPELVGATIRVLLDGWFSFSIYPAMFISPRSSAPRATNYGTNICIMISQVNEIIF